MKAKRRKLIQGALAAPMIFTLGPAIAGGKHHPGPGPGLHSAGVCLKRSDINVWETGGAVKGDADQWVRLPVALLQLIKERKGAPPLQLDGVYIRSYDEHFYYRVALDDPSKSPVATQLKVGQDNLTEQNVGTGYALVRIQKYDENAPAEIAGFAWGGTHGAIASFTCAGSAGLVVDAAGMMNIG